MNDILIIWVNQFTHIIILQATGRTLLTFVTSGGTPQCIVVTVIFNEAAIVLFCQELKTLGDFTYSNSKRQVTQNMVI